jgi:two-component system OmpR family response regulator
LPDGSGLDWLRSRRSRGDTTPALMLTARDLLTDRICGLDSGADDYLVKPFAPEKLTARLRVGRIEIDLAARSAHLAGQRVELTAREWAILEALLLRAGRIVAKHDLERLVLGFDVEWASNAVEVHVAGLRRKLGREIVETIRGLGYRIGAQP